MEGDRSFQKLPPNILRILLASKLKYLLRAKVWLDPEYGVNLHSEMASLPRRPGWNTVVDGEILR